MVELACVDRCVQCQAKITLQKVLEILLREGGFQRGQLTVDDAVKMLLESKRAANRSEIYISSLRQYLSLFAEAHKKTAILDINPEHIRLWFQRRKEAPNTQRSNMGRLSALFEFCVRNGYRMDNPIKAIEPPTADLRTPTILTPEQSWRLVAVCKEKLPSFVGCLVLMLYCCLRPSEAMRVSQSHIDTANWCVRVQSGKVRRFRIVPVPACVRGYLTNVSAMSLSTYKRRFRELQKLSGIKLGQDMLRHSCLSYHLALHQDLTKVATMAGNSPNMLKEHYNGLATEADAKRFFNPPSDSV